MICVQCGQKSKASRDDDEFCQECFDRIEDMANNPMPHAHAARAYIDSLSGPHREKVSMYAFLSIFHPTMSHARKRELSEPVR